MKEAQVFNNNELAARLIFTGKEYIFRYEDDYFRDNAKRGISLTLPKTQQEYRSNILFPFFFNMLSEGANRKLQAREFRINENDHFSFLMITAGSDTIGAVTVKPTPLITSKEDS